MVERLSLFCYFDLSCETQNFASLLKLEIVKLET